MKIVNSLFKQKNCPVCGSQAFKIISHATYPKNINKDELMDMYSSSSDHILMDQLVECSNCSMKYINPQVIDDIIFKSYEDAVDPTFIKQNLLRIATFKRNLKKISYRLKITPSSNIKVLDIGCAGGAFPYAANELGFSVIGVEPSLWLANKAKEEYNLDIRPGSLKSQDFQSNTFNIITLWDVIEHLTDPVDVLEDIQKVLKKNGLVIINYPNYNSLARFLLRKKWPFFLSVHLSYFTPKTIKILMDKNNFEVLSSRPYWQTLELEYILERASAYFKFFKILTKIIKFLGLEKFPIRYNMGQTLVVARKKS